MVEATCSALQNAPQNSLKRVVFVLFTPETVQPFEEAVARASL
jgi:hypothetical protein